MTLRAAAPLLLLGTLACASSAPEATPPPAPAPVAATPGGGLTAGAPVPAAGAAAAVDAAGLTPEALYESCRSRVEGRESAAECETDEDCMATGCSGEVCVTKADGSIRTEAFVAYDLAHGVSEATFIEAAATADATTEQQTADPTHPGWGARARVY